MAHILMQGTIGVFLSFLLYRYILYSLIFSPLSKIPSPHWSCHISRLWILRARNKGYENAALQSAHNNYGPIVRVGPNELNVDGYDLLKTVYQGGFEKDRWYSIFNNYGMPCMFSTLGSKEHSIRKRMISNVYAKSYIQHSTAAKAQARAILFSRLLPLLVATDYEEPNGIDVFSIFISTAMDFISAYIFGLNNGTNFIQDKELRNHWLQLYLARADYAFWPQELPGLTRFCSRIGLRLYPIWVDESNAEISEWNKRVCESVVRGMNSENRSPLPEDEAVVFNALNCGIDKEAQKNGDKSLVYPTTIVQRSLSVASELMDQVLAGQETAGIALTYFTWHMSKSLELQQKLRKELLTLNPPMKVCTSTIPDELPDPKQIDALPLLHATLTETLRLHAPIPGPQPRSTPYPLTRLGPYNVPGGVRIAAAGYTLHRNAKVFPDAEKWDHRRWMDNHISPEQKVEMQRHFWAFGSGGRMCIGSNFAMNEMKQIIAAIYTNFTSHIVDDSGIEQEDAYTARPFGERLIIKFKQIE